MPAEISWYLEKRIILARFYGSITAEEVQNLNQQLLIMTREEGVAPVHVVMDSTELEQIPLSIKTVTEASPILREAKLGWIVLITNNRIYNFFGAMISQVSHVQLKTVSSMDEAIGTLERVDSSLLEHAQAS